MKLEELTVITPAPTPGDTSWFTHDRFGMFIHWGLYALGARHEWLKNHERIPTEVYDENTSSILIPTSMTLLSGQTPRLRQE